MFYAAKLTYKRHKWKIHHQQKTKKKQKKKQKVRTRECKKGKQKNTKAPHTKQCAPTYPNVYTVDGATIDVCKKNPKSKSKTKTKAKTQLQTNTILQTHRLCIHIIKHFQNKQKCKGM